MYQIVRSKLALMGFVPNQQKNNRRIFSTHQTIGIFLLVLFISDVALYFFYGANGTAEYMYSIFTLTVAIGIAIAYASLAFNNDKILDTIDTQENVLNQSKFQFWCIPSFGSKMPNNAKLSKNVSAIQFFRIGNSSNEKNARENRWSNRKTQWIHSFCFDVHCIAGIRAAKSHSQLFQLLHHGFWTRCLWFTVRDVASVCSTFVLRFFMFSFLAKLNFNLFQLKVAIWLAEPGRIFDSSRFANHYGFLCASLFHVFCCPYSWQFSIRIFTNWGFE